MAHRWLLIDVDGTLSPTSVPAEETVRVVAPAGEATIPTATVEALRRLHTTGMVSLAWYTAWEEDAQTILAPQIGLPDLPLVPVPDGYDDPSYLKAEGLRAWLSDAGPARVAVLDDAPPESLPPMNGTVKFFPVNPARGARATDIGRAYDWLLSDCS